MRLNTVNIKVKTPDGTMYVNIMENSYGKPERVFIEIGKTGMPVRSWTQAVQDLINLAIKNDISLGEIAVAISGNKTGSSAHNEEGQVRSGIEGVMYAILVYQNNKFVSETDMPYFNFPWAARAQK